MGFLTGMRVKNLNISIPNTVKAAGLIVSMNIQVSLNIPVVLTNVTVNTCKNEIPFLYIFIFSSQLSAYSIITGALHLFPPKYSWSIRLFLHT